MCAKTGNFIKIMRRDGTDLWSAFIPPYTFFLKTFRRVRSREKNEVFRFDRTAKRLPLEGKLAKIEDF